MALKLSLQTFQEENKQKEQFNNLGIMKIKKESVSSCNSSHNSIQLSDKQINRTCIEENQIGLDYSNQISYQTNIQYYQEKKMFKLKQQGISSLYLQLNKNANQKNIE
ncbi:hypothetical protein PPERSA_09412 [Pseudocohnilembus persalinus]|uniref:Uncharacterized protein n=1 Tax=Pseudocohnilembus persalinus TaxID=266149 RepID=A0A0V0Q9Y6_PSEPJ|nr:hypothetical protein PPERSA_09412 [Pseudocohnilembus persalinus]|eukprot:KRW98887.1 hypothetical protein PPERSA_09412 [Pseudocohnilembus persalinus]